MSRKTLVLNALQSWLMYLLACSTILSMVNLVVMLAPMVTFNGIMYMFGGFLGCLIGSLFLIHIHNIGR